MKTALVFEFIPADPDAYEIVIEAADEEAAWRKMKEYGFSPKDIACWGCQEKRIE